MPLVAGSSETRRMFQFQTSTDLLLLLLYIFCVFKIYAVDLLSHPKVGKMQQYNLMVRKQCIKAHKPSVALKYNLDIVKFNLWLKELELFNILLCLCVYVHLLFIVMLYCFTVTVLRSCFKFSGTSI